MKRINEDGLDLDSRRRRPLSRCSAEDAASACSVGRAEMASVVPSFSEATHDQYHDAVFASVRASVYVRGGGRRRRSQMRGALVPLP
jgi:hypothetical protein